MFDFVVVYLHVLNNRFPPNVPQKVNLIQAFFNRSPKKVFVISCSFINLLTSLLFVAKSKPFQLQLIENLNKKLKSKAAFVHSRERLYSCITFWWRHSPGCLHTSRNCLQFRLDTSILKDCFYWKRLSHYHLTWGEMFVVELGYQK